MERSHFAGNGMPLRLKTRCAVRGCPNTTRQRYCDEHLPLARKVWDRSRGTTTERGYDGAWKQVAEQRRDLDCGLCQRCLPTGRVVPSQLVTTSSRSTSVPTGA